jgi:hypothetical protein
MLIPRQGIREQEEQKHKVNYRVFRLKNKNKNKNKNNKTFHQKPNYPLFLPVAEELCCMTLFHLPLSLPPFSTL